MRIDTLLPHLRDLDLQDGEVIGGILLTVNAGVGLPQAHPIEGGQRRELRTVPPGKAHGGLSADDAPALPGPVHQAVFGLIGVKGGGGRPAAGGLQPAGNNRHGGVGRLHPGPGLDRRPELSPGQGQDHTR